MSRNYHSCSATYVKPILLILLTTLVTISGIATLLSIDGGPQKHDNNAYASFPGANGKIAFGVAEGAGNIACGGEIILMNPDGTGPALLPAGCGSSPAFSADGTRLVYDEPGWDYDVGVMGGTQIVAVNVDGTNGKILSPANRTTWDSSPSFSPDGTKVVFIRQLNYASNLNIYVMNADGSGSAKRLTNATVDDFEPSFSPDGTKIVFARTGKIYTMNANDGSNQTNLTKDPTANDWEPSFSPDGSKIAFARTRDHGNPDIYVMNAHDGTQLKRLTNSSASDSSPAWSPDGNKIAFMSSRDRNGPNNEIYVMNADGSNQTKITRFNSIPNDGLPHYGPPSWGPEMPQSFSNMIVSNDKSRPSVRILSPMNGSSFTFLSSLGPSNIGMYGTASDTGSGIKKVEVRVDSGAFQRAGGNMIWMYTIPTSSLLPVPEGVHYITVKATDAAGNVGIYNSTIIVNLVKPPTPSPPATTVIPSTITGNIIVADRSSCLDLSADGKTTAATATTASTSPIPPARPSSSTKLVTTTVWDSTTRTCTISDGALAVTKTGSLTIPSSVVLRIAKSATLANNGTIVSGGAIKNDGTIDNFGIINNAGIMENYGLLKNSGALSTSNTINNYGTIDIYGKSGRLVNSGYINIYSKLGGKIADSGTIINSGHILTR